jgi:hypothetical protein
MVPIVLSCMKDILKFHFDEGALRGNPKNFTQFRNHVIRTSVKQMKMTLYDDELSDTMFPR